MMLKRGLYFIIFLISISIVSSAGIYEKTLSLPIINDTSWWNSAGIAATQSSCSLPAHKVIFFGGDSGRFGYYNTTRNVTINLMNKDPADWVGSMNLDSLACAGDSVYFVSSSGDTDKFGYYNLTTDKVTNLYNSTGMEIMNSFALVYDNDSNRIFGTNFYYDIANNVTINYSDTGMGEARTVSSIRGLVYSPNDKRVYMSGTKDRFYYYDVATNVTHNITSTAEWMNGIGNYYNLAHDPFTNLIYISRYQENTFWGAYNITDNITYGLYNSSNNWLAADNYRADLEFNKDNRLLYFATGSNFLGYYNITTNITYGLDSQGASTLIYDNDSKNIYLGTTSGTQYYYNESTNTTYIISNDGDRWPGGTITDLDTNNQGLIFEISDQGRYGFYNITSDTFTDLSDTDSEDFLSTSSLRSIEYFASNQSFLITGGGYIALYDPILNQTFNLKDSDNGNNFYSNLIYDAVYCSEPDVVFLVGNGGGMGMGNGIYGYYNLTDNTTVYLLDTGVTMNMGSTLFAAAYDEERDIVYFGGNDGSGSSFLAYYNFSNNQTYNLKDTDEGGFLDGEIRTMVFSENEDLLYYGGYDSGFPASAEFGYYNISSNITSNLLGDNMSGITNSVEDMTYDNNTNNLYFSMTDSTNSIYTLFMYNSTSNNTYNYSYRDASWIFNGESFTATTYDDSTDRLYFGVSYNKFGFFGELTITDSTKPIPEFIAPTQDNNTFINHNNSILANISLTETNPNSITFGLYNESGIINQTLQGLTAGSSINLSYNWSDNLFDGTYYYNVTVNDTSNNINFTETRWITIDKTYPTINITSPTATTYTSSSITIQAAFGDANLATCWYTLNNGGTNTTVSCAAFSATTTLSNAAYNLIIYANDTASNENSTTVGFTVSVTSSPPSSGGTSGGDNGGGGASQPPEEPEQPPTEQPPEEPEQPSEDLLPDLPFNLGNLLPDDLGLITGLVTDDGVLMDLGGKGQIKFNPFSDPSMAINLAADGLKGAFSKLFSFVLIPYFWLIALSILSILAITTRFLVKDVPIESSNKFLKFGIALHLIDGQTHALNQKILEVKKHIKNYQYREALISYENLKDFYSSIKDNMRADKARNYARRLTEIDNEFSKY